MFLLCTGMEEFLKNFKSVRNMQTLVPSRDQGVPLELHQQAKDLVTSQRHQYSVLNIYDIIVHNLKAGRKVENIKQGLFSISKYPLCLFLDQERPEFHQIRVSGWYTDKQISNKQTNKQTNEHKYTNNKNALLIYQTLLYSLCL